MELQGSESERRYAQVTHNSRIPRLGSDSLKMAQASKSSEPRIRKIVARAIRRPARRIDFAVRLHRYRTSLGFAAAIPQVANEFLTRVELCARRLVSIEIAHETNAERDVVQIIAVHVASIDLPSPAIADFDLAVAS